MANFTAAAFLALLVSALLVTAAPPAAAAAATKSAEANMGNINLKVTNLEQDQLPPAQNPYAGKPYAGCEGGYCPSADFELEKQFYKAAEKGNLKAVKQLLSNKSLNLTRNIVPDSEGFSRVVDVAVWAASFNGHVEVMKALLQHEGVKKLYEYEDGHILDLAAMQGHTKMVEYLLSEKMPVGSSAMAHAAHYNHTDIMALLINKPMDLKAAMQAVSGGGSPQMAAVLIKALKLVEQSQAAEKRQTRHDFKAEFAQIATSKGNLEFLKLLFKEYDVPYTAAQQLIKAAAENGDQKIFDLIMNQESIQEDQEEIEEAVGNGLKVAAEMGQEDIAEYIVEKYPKEAAAHCKAAVFRAYKYGHFDIGDAIAKACEIDKNGAKLQEAKWLGDLVTAAHKGDTEAAKKLLQVGDAAQRVAKLQQRMTDPKTGKKGPFMPPHITQDPLVIAAKNGHSGMVELLAQFYTLCAGCAAAEAARNNHTTLAMYLASGAGRAMMNDDGATINNALKVVAFSMEEGNWELVAWMIKEHESAELGPYFLPAIAQEGKVEDLQKMMDILIAAGLHKTVYFKEQVQSAKITAALAGHVDLLLALEEHAAPLTPEEIAADNERKGGPPQGEAHYESNSRDEL